MENITKRFGKVVANSHIDLDLYTGEILSLLGENGSGKTTLMNMLSGIYFPDEGQIYIHGEPVTIASPKDAFAHGIGMIHQHFKLVDLFTATENIVLGLDEPGRLDLAAASKKVQEICDRYGFDIDPNQKIYDMSVSQKQTVEIVKVLYRGADILILDEPTAVLTPQETDKLFQIMRNMKADGKSLIIITHKLHEVLCRVRPRGGAAQGRVHRRRRHEGRRPAVTDRYDGRSRRQAEHRSSRPRQRHAASGHRRADRAGRAGRHAAVNNVSFTINAGEVLGIAGIAGSGQRELLESIAGLYPITSGSVRYFPPDGSQEKQLVGLDPMDIRKSGIAMSFVPEDRLGMGLVGSMGMTGNMMLRSWRKGASIFVDRKNPEELANRIWQELDVVTPSTSFPVRRMSGGNVQKVLVGREIAQAPAVLMTAYAVRGLDINTSYTIYNLLTEQKMKGVAVVYVGEDLDVLLELCDRIVVLCGGEVSGEVDARTTDKRQIGTLMTQVGGEAHA